MLLTVLQQATTADQYDGTYLALQHPRHHNCSTWAYESAYAVSQIDEVFLKNVSDTDVEGTVCTLKVIY